MAYPWGLIVQPNEVRFLTPCHMPEDPWIVSPNKGKDSRGFGGRVEFGWNVNESRVFKRLKAQQGWVKWSPSGMDCLREPVCCYLGNNKDKCNRCAQKPSSEALHQSWKLRLLVYVMVTLGPQARVRCFILTDMIWNSNFWKPDF